jgi:ATP-dependent Clp protease ATP-binding subunit ClpC
MQMEDELHKRVISQDEAIKAISKAVRRSRSGLKDPKRPDRRVPVRRPDRRRQDAAGQGAGRVHVRRRGRADPDRHERVHGEAQRQPLIGAPPGYVGYEEGGQLTEKIRRRPYAVVLLDEIEKAHPDVFNMLLQIMEEGRLTDSFGRKVDFRNTI